MIALRGRLYTGTITTVAGSNGTQQVDVEARILPFVVNTGGRTFRAGREGDKTRVFSTGPERFALDIAFRQFTADVMSLAMAPYELDGGGYSPDGTGAETRNKERTGTAMIIRPVDATGLYLYVKRAVLFTTEMIVKYSDDLPALDGQTVRFIATRLATDTEPAWFLGTPAQIAAAYAGLAAGT